MFAAVGIPLVIAIGVSVDLMHAYLVKNRLAAALDSAALAAGAHSGDAGTLQSLAASYLAANFPTGNGVILNAPTYNVASSPASITASAVVTTTFLQAVGINTITVDAATQVVRQTSGLEVALVLDNTGSLYCCKGMNGNNQTNIQALRQAAGNLAITLFGGVTTDNKLLRVAVVPYNGVVNPVPVVIPNGSTTPGAFAAKLTANASEPSYVTNVAKYYAYKAPSADYSAGAAGGDDATQWLGCVEESSAYKTVGTNPRMADMATALDAPLGTGSGAFTIFYNQPTSSNSWTAWTSRSGAKNVSALRWSDGATPNGPNRGCPVPVTPLTNNLAPILATIGYDASTNKLKSGAGMNAWSGTDTNGALGVAWGYRVLSPSGPYAGVSTINDWTTDNWRKAVVLMTDGVNNYGDMYTGLGPYNRSYSATGFDNQEKATCDLLKSKGVTVFTVFVNSSSSSSVSNGDSATLRYCAGTQVGVGDTNYFFAANNQQALASAFQTIGQQLTNLRITQ